MHLADLKIDRDRLAALCRRYGIVRLEVMGSFARGDASADSDGEVRGHAAARRAGHHE